MGSVVCCNHRQDTPKPGLGTMDWAGDHGLGWGPWTGLGTMDWTILTEVSCLAGLTIVNFANRGENISTSTTYI